MWFLHGLGDSAATWREAFDRPALEGRELRAIDLPGFGGAPPLHGEPVGLERLAEHVLALGSGASRVVLVGHSMGGAVATLVAERRPAWLAGLVNVEGNLTEDDCTISASAAAASDFPRWFAAFAETIRRADLPRYHEGLLACDRPAFLAAARDLVASCRDSALGRRYAVLELPRVYFHGTKEFPARSRGFLAAAGLETRAFEGAGHWVMGDAPDAVYTGIARWVEALDR